MTSHLESVMQFNNEGMFDVSKDVSLHLGPHSIPNLERGLPQYLHRVQRACVLAKVFPDKKNTTE
jgi:hypothetical protein